MQHLKIKTLEDAFEFYFRSSSAPDASLEERDAARKDFYAGAASVVTLITQDKDPEEFVSRFHAVQEEIAKHVMERMAGMVGADRDHGEVKYNS